MKLLKKIVKYTGITVSIIVVLLVVALLFLSPIAKWAIQKYDKQYTGREITIGDLSINAFTGKLSINNLSVFEADGKTVFLSLKDFDTKISVMPLFKQKYNIEHVTINDFFVAVKQNGSQFNFDDLLKLGESKPDEKPEPVDPNAPPTEWFLNNVKINNSRIFYSEKQVGSKITLSKFNVSLPDFAYNTPQLKLFTDFLINETGAIKSQLNLNTNSMEYTLLTQIEKLDISPFYVYLKEFLLAKQLKGLINTDLNVKGNFSDASDITLKGRLNFHDFLLTDPLNDNLSSFKDLNVLIDSVNVKQSIFDLNTISLQNAFVKVELYENGTNFNRLMKTTEAAPAQASADSSAAAPASGASSTNIFLIIADYVKMVAKDYILNSYSADQVELKNLEVDYSDFTLGEQFYMNMDSLNVSSSRISSSNERITANVNSRLNRKGKLNVDISANPKDFLEMDFKTEVKKLPLTVFNPYVKYYLAHTFTKGDFNLLISTSISAAHDLNSENGLLIEKIKCGKKIKDVKTAANMPLKLGVALLRDPKGNIDFKFPVKGNLNDPKYRIGKIVLKIFENLLIKAVTSPYNAVASLFSKSEPATDFEFDYLQSDFSAGQQRKVLDKTAEFLTEKPELTIQFTQNVNPEKELESLAYKMAKLKYLSDSVRASAVSEAVRLNPDKLDNKDSLFVKFVSEQNQQLATQLSHLDKCKRFVGENEILKEHQRIIEMRENQIRNIFGEKGIEAKRVVFVRNIDKKLNMNEVKPTFSFEMDSAE
ncbi:MAG: DUF748 domain-containing protein [Bacteroidia bacterium]|nr:DUF748 domain-containing protein [Bacteroidia bacterium]